MGINDKPSAEQIVPYRTEGLCCWSERVAYSEAEFEILAYRAALTEGNQPSVQDDHDDVAQGSHAKAHLRKKENPAGTLLIAFGVRKPT